MAFESNYFGRQIELQIDDSLYSSADFRIDFRVEKTSDSKPNKAVISIYNLNRLSESWALAQNSDLFIRLYASSVNEPSLIFTGNPVKDGVLFDWSNGDRILRFEARDGLKFYQTTAADFSFRSKTSLKQVVTEIVASAGLAIATIEVPDYDFPRGVHVSGRMADMLDRLAKLAKCEWTVQDSRLIFIPTATFRRETAIVFASDLNLIETPKPRDKGGVVAKSLMFPELNPGDAFVVDSDSGFLDGEYKATKVTHTGSNWTNEWYTIAEGTPRIAANRRAVGNVSSSDAAALGGNVSVVNGFPLGAANASGQAGTVQNRSVGGGIAGSVEFE